MSYYVWPAHSSGKPVAGEGPWGPYSPLTRAKTFARIGAQKGTKDRIVTQGKDPDKIVRHYRAGTGERIHANPGRPPKHWMRDCIKGVRAGGSAKDPGAVCGSLWHQKLSESQRRAILKKERAMGGLVENPQKYDPGRNAHSIATQKGYPYIRGEGRMDKNGRVWLSRFTKTSDGRGPALYVGFDHVAGSKAVIEYDTQANPTCPCENPRGTRLNDRERELWVLNDKYLYDLHMMSRKSMRAFLKENRDEIDAHIRKVLDQPPSRANPSDPYRTWLMDVRRQLQRTGYPEAAGRLGAHERDLRGIYLSGAGTGDAARVVSEAYRRGDFAANPVGAGGVLLAIGAALGIGAVIYYFATREKAAAPAGSLAPGGKPLVPPPPACVVDEGKLHVFGQNKGLLSVYLPACPAATPPVQNQPAPPAICWDAPAPPAWAALWATVLKTEAPIVPILLVLRDGSFWTYGGSPPVPARRDDLRAEYCQFAAGKFVPGGVFQPAQGADPASAFIL